MTPRYDVIVTGGGIIGLSIALRLAQSGRTVCLVERGQIGRESSWAGAGIIDAGSYARTDALARLRRAGVSAYQSFAAEIQSISGIDPEYRVDGSLDLITDRSQAAAAQRQLDACAISMTSSDSRRSHLEIVDRHRLMDLQPGISPEFERALFSSTAASVRNPRLMRGLAAACSRLGVELRADLPVEQLAISEGRVVGVETPIGSITADWVVLAAGAWSSQLHPLLAEIAPVRPVRGQIVAFGPLPGALTRLIHLGKHYLVPRGDGLILAGATQEEAGFQNETTPHGLRKLRELAVRILPALANAPIAAHWSGLRPATPDGRPYIGPVSELPGLLLATGHFRSGLTLAPATARVISEWVTEQRSQFDITPFLASRHRAADFRTSAANPVHSA